MIKAAAIITLVVALAATGHALYHSTVLRSRYQPSDPSIASATR